MLRTSIILLVITGFFGLILLNFVLKTKKTPRLVVYAHGFFALLSLVIIGFIVAINPDQLLITSLVLLILAAFGGIFMFVKDMRQQIVPKIVAKIHPLIAISGFAALVIYFLYH